MATLKVAFISDIHGNLDALRAALAEVADADALVCCGDLVDYYDCPNECCDEVRSAGIPTVIGNHDQFIIGSQAYDKRKESLYRVRWSRERLSQKNLQWLQSLPVGLLLKFDGWKFTVRHASPWDVSTYLYEDSTHLDLIRLKNHECLVVGHTHRRFALLRGGGLLLNVGSIGQPRFGSPGADVAVFDTTTGGHELRRISYDVQQMQERLRNLDWPPVLIDKLANPGHQYPIM